MKYRVFLWIILFAVALAACTAAPSAATPTAQPASGSVDDQGVILSWVRTGGIAGFCDKLLVYADGRALASTCATQNNPTSFQLSTEQITTLKDWRQRFSNVEYEQSDPAVADAMSTGLSLSGTGQETPTEAEKMLMVDFAQTIFADATK